MTDGTTSLNLITAVRFAYASLRPSIRDELAEAEANKHGITICNEQDCEPIIIVYDELPLFRAFLEHLDQFSGSGRLRDGRRRRPEMGMLDKLERYYADNGILATRFTCSHRDEG